MSSENFSDLSVNELVSIYAGAATTHLASTEAGDADTANARHDVIAAAYRELRHRGPDAQAALLPLLDNPDPGIRIWAGAHALEFSPEDGEATLEELSTTGGIAGFEAEMTLETWRRGDLRFP